MYSRNAKHFAIGCSKMCWAEKKKRCSVDEEKKKSLLTHRSGRQCSFERFYFAFFFIHSTNFLFHLYFANSFALCFSHYIRYVLENSMVCVLCCTVGRLFFCFFFLFLFNLRLFIRSTQKNNSVRQARQETEQSRAVHSRPKLKWFVFAHKHWWLLPCQHDTWLKYTVNYIV